MDYQIFVEKQPNNGFIATALGWPDCVGTGETKDEAVVKVRAAVAERLARGEILRIQVAEPQSAESTDPWEAMIGSCLDDPTWDEFQAELRRIREEANRA
ncbi:MAG: type II toxin-antitoxin system HicB family antitoxin [Blastocatellia bacterium]